MRWTAAAALLAVVVACGIGARAARWPEVFRGDAIVFTIGDPYYHLRRAEFTLETGGVLLFDPLVNQPDGAWIPWPPLHTLLLAGAAELLGGSRAALERVGAWYPAVVGAATALPVYGAARAVGGPGVALLAAAIAALLPASVTFSDLGNADHHVTVSFFGALWLWGALRSMRSGAARDASLSQLLSCAGRLGVLFTWPGSLLYLAIADGSCIAIALLCGRADLLRPIAMGLGLTAGVVALAVPLLGPPMGGPYSTLALSYLHPAAMAALAFQALACAWLEERRPAKRVALRLARAAGVAAVGIGAMLLLPGLLASLREAFGFVGKQDPWASQNAEQQPLFASWLQPLWYYGGFAFLLPIAPIAAAWRARDPAHREPALVLAIWTAAFGVLAATQLRYGSDYAPSAAVGFAVAADEIGRRFGAGTTRARVATSLVAVLGLAPMAAQHALQIRASLAASRQPIAGDPRLATVTGSLVGFAEEIRRVTPETAGYFDPAATPEYAILCPANIGHVLHYVARRATPSDNFGPYAGSRHFDAAQAFFNAKSEQRAWDVAERLRARYVVTVEFGGVHPRGLTQRLHREDGVQLWEELPRWERFRLVTEGPKDGQLLSGFFGARPTPGVVPYKLWERVPGAVLEVSAAPGSAVRASVTVRTPTGRTFRYLANGTAGEDGIVRLRVPYATDGTTPARTTGPWVVQAGLAHAQVDVPESAVRTGATLAVALPETR